MPFVTNHGIAQHVAESTGEMLMAMGARMSTAAEAAECVNRMVMSGNKDMSVANEEFKKIYSNPLPNPAMSGFSIQKEMREHSEIFNHLFDSDGNVI